MSFREDMTELWYFARFMAAGTLLVVVPFVLVATCAVWLTNRIFGA